MANCAAPSTHAAASRKRAHPARRLGQARTVSGEDLERNPAGGSGSQAMVIGPEFVTAAQSTPDCAAEALRPLDQVDDDTAIQIDPSHHLIPALPLLLQIAVDLFLGADPAWAGREAGEEILECVSGTLSPLRHEDDDLGGTFLYVLGKLQAEGAVLGYMGVEFDGSHRESLPGDVTCFPGPGRGGAAFSPRTGGRTSFSSLVLAVFLVAVGINLRRGRRISCGCLGRDSEEIRPEVRALRPRLPVGLDATRRLVRVVARRSARAPREGGREEES